MKIARLISYILHPVFIPFIGIVILFQSGSWLSLLNPEAKRYVYLVSFMATVLVPLVSVYFLKQIGWISGLMMPDPKERRIPLMLVSFFTLAGAYILQRVSAPVIFPLFLNGVSITLLICALISSMWKISTHMVGIGGLIGLILGISMKWMLDLRLILSLLIIGASLIAYSRLKLKAHNQYQIYSGLLLGFISIFLLIRLI